MRVHTDHLVESLISCFMSNSSLSLFFFLFLRSCIDEKQKRASVLRLRRVRVCEIYLDTFCPNDLLFVWKG